MFVVAWERGAHPPEAPVIRASRPLISLSTAGVDMLGSFAGEWCLALAGRLFVKEVDTLGLGYCPMSSRYARPPPMEGLLFVRSRPQPRYEEVAPPHWQRRLTPLATHWLTWVPRSRREQRPPTTCCTDRRQ